MGLVVTTYNVAKDTRTRWQKFIGVKAPTLNVGPSAVRIFDQANSQNRAHAKRWHGKIGAIHIPRKPTPF